MHDLSVRLLMVTGQARKGHTRGPGIIGVRRRLRFEAFRRARRRAVIWLAPVWVDSRMITADVL